MEFGSEVQHWPQKTVSITSFLSETQSNDYMYVVTEMDGSNIVRSQAVKTMEEAETLKESWQHG